MHHRVNRFTLCLLSFTLCLISSQAFAQLSEGGIPPSFGLKTAAADIATITTRPPNVPALLAEDESEEAKDIPFRFGYPYEVAYDLTNSGTWDTLADGSRIWRLRIECPEAYSINLVYRMFWMPPGARFYIYNEDRSHLIGAFTERNNKEYGEFATAPVPGAVSILEYYEPAAVSGQGLLSIQRIVHAYRDIFAIAADKDAAGFGGSGSCNNNVNCPEGALWQDDKRAVAMILTSGGFRLCSGALVNNLREDLTPYFLTANHCLGGEATWVFMFNYESPACANVDGPTWMTVSGSIRRANYANSDFALLELLEQPPDSYNVYYAGWSAINEPAPSGVVGIHHPSGDIKKISFDYDAVVSANYGGSTGGTHWRVVAWNDGTTEGGSSGSPLFDSLTHRVVGQLHGGTASCASITSDYYGKIAMSWNGGGTSATRLRDWLDPDNSGILQLDGLDPAGAGLSALPTSGDAPLNVQFNGTSFLPVDQWIWAFGDGDSAFVQSPTHEYTAPGIYDVSLAVVAGVDTVHRDRMDYVIALADTLKGKDTVSALLDTVEVVISATNTVPLSYIVIPASYGGDLDMSLLSYSTAGCRTDYFTLNTYLHVNDIGKQATIRLQSSNNGSVPELDPGTGPIVKLYFQTTADMPDDSTVVNLSGYSTYNPIFTGSLLTYAPKIESPTVLYAGCCDGIRGDFSGDGSTNITDLTLLVSHLFSGGPDPECFEEGDVDGNGAIVISDITFLVNFLFKGGPAPVPC